MGNATNFGVGDAFLVGDTTAEDNGAFDGAATLRGKPAVGTASLVDEVGFEACVSFEGKTTLGTRQTGGTAAPSEDEATLGGVASFLDKDTFEGFVTFEAEITCDLAALEDAVTLEALKGLRTALEGNIELD